MDKDNKQMLIVVMIIIGIVLIKNAGLFSINLQTSDIQFYNKEINLPFTYTNFTNPEIEVYFNDVKIYDVLSYQLNESNINSTTNETYYTLTNYTRNQSIILTKSISNGTNYIGLKNINSAGLIKIKLTEGNYSEIKSIEVRKGYVDIKDNIPSLVDKGKVWTISVSTYNPQGDILEADSVDIDVYDPSNNKETLYLEKSGNNFTKTFNYDTAGNYELKIHAKKEGYETKEITRITSATNEGGIHPIVYVWIAAAGLFVLMFLVRLLIRRKK